jgi:hypothetical protein
VRCVQIACEIDEAIDDAEPVEVLLERCKRNRERFEMFKRTGNYDTSDDEYELVKAKTKAGMLARHREYQWRRAELGRLLQLGPEDINPLDLDLDQEWENADDPRIEVWQRAHKLRYRLDQAHLDRMLWWCAPPPVQIVKHSSQEGEPNVDVDAGPEPVT